jgi:hypothetical protein
MCTFTCVTVAVYRRYHNTHPAVYLGYSYLK